MKCRVAIVEDEASVLHSLLRGLRAIESLELEGYPSAEDAMKSLDKGAPDLLITDIRLPGQSGLDLIAEIHRRSIVMPIIVTTAHKSSYSERLDAFGDLSVLEKPVSVSVLRNTVLKKLEKSKNTGASPFRLAEYIQLVGMGGHSLRLKVEGKGGAQGSIEVFSGEIWSAEYGGETGMEALRLLLALREVNVHFEPLMAPPHERNVEGRWDGLLIDLARQEDEESRELSDDELDFFGEGAETKKPHVPSTGDVCRSMVEDLEDCIAVGVVDLSTGIVLGSHHVESQSAQPYFDAVAASVFEMFRGSAVQRVEELLSQQYGEEIRDSYEEAFVSSIKEFYFMMLIREKESVVVMVTKKTSNQGLGWATLRGHIEEIVETLP